MQARLAGIGIADGGGFVTRALARVQLAYGGIAGDLHAGRTRRACSRAPWHPRGTDIANTREIAILSVEELAEVAALLSVARIDPAYLGGNIVTAGIHPLSAAPPSTRLRFPSGATLFVTEENMPCADPGRALAAALGLPELAARFAKAAIGRRGLVAIVEREGEAALGDAIQLIAPKPRRLPAAAPDQAAAA